MNCSIEDLCDPTLKEQKLEASINWSDIKSRLEAVLNFEIKAEIENKKLETRRDVLQFLGTEVLRKVDPNFHINSLKDQIEKDKNYVLDDTRFINELNLLNSLGASCILTIRPQDQKYSNHASETELNRKYFERIIINNRPKEKIIEHFIRFLENKTNLKNSVESRSGGRLSDFFLSENPESCYCAGWIYASSKKTYTNNCLLIQVDNSVYPENYPNDLFSIYDDRKIIDNQIYIDDFKRWDILQEDKCMYSYPEIIKDKKELQDFWFKGIKKSLETKTNS